MSIKATELLTEFSKTVLVSVVVTARPRRTYLKVNSEVETFIPQKRSICKSLEISNLHIGFLTASMAASSTYEKLMKTYDIHQ